MKRAAGMLFGMLTLLSAPAFAAPANPDQAVDDAAKARYTEGLKLYNKKRYEEARVAFLQASALKKRPSDAAGAVGVGGLVTAAIFGGLAANARHGVEVANETLARNAPQGASCTKPASFNDPAKGQTIETFQETCDTLKTQQGWATTHQAVFSASLIVGLAGLGGAITWFLVAPRPGTNKKEKVPPIESVIVPWVGPMGAGASWEGRF